MTIESTSHIVLVACPLTGELVPTGPLARVLLRAPTLLLRRPR